MASDPDRTQALLQRLQRLSHLPSSFKPETVHQLRTTVRRVETLMAATWPSDGRSSKKLAKQLDRIRRRAGKVRDLDVQIAALGSLRLESIARDKAKVRRFLEKFRAKRERKLLKTCREELRDGLQRRLKRTATRLHEAPSADRSRLESRRRQLLSSALDKFATAARRRPALSEANLHDFRMDCKRARYVAEMAGEGPEVTAVVGQLKRIQDAIGEWHDWLTLANTVENLVSLSGQSPLVSALRASTRSKCLEALRTTADAKRNLLEMRAWEQKRKPAASFEAGLPKTRAATA